MEKDFGSWFHHQHPDRESPNLDTLGAQFNLGLQHAMPTHISPCLNALPMKESVPAFSFAGPPHFNAIQQLNKPHGWFYCLPRLHQAVIPAPISCFKEKLTPSPNPLVGCAQKRFMVFDQSGDQTTLFFSPVVGSPPVQCATLCGLKHDSTYHLNKTGLGTGRTALQREPVLTYECKQNKKDDTESEMYCEDTAELNALLYSDDDDDDGVYSDDEVASTGHSPSGMTDYGKQELVEEGEEVASSYGPTKKRKLSDGDYDLPLLMDTATSVKSKRCFDFDNDAEYRCADCKSQGLGEFGYLWGNKCERKDKIRETVSILQRIIPGGEGKDAIGVLDEAIGYLRLLKRKAKALGVDTL